MDWTSIISGGLSGSFGLIGNAIQARQNRKLASQQEMYNLVNLNVQKQLQSDLWQEQFNAQNEYNSPQAQLERLYDANINPLFQGGLDGSSSMGSSASLGLPSAGIQRSPDYASSFQNAFTQALASRHIENESKKTDADVNKTNAEAEKISVETALLPDSTSANIALWTSQAAQALSQSDVNEKTLSVIDANVEVAKQSVAKMQGEIDIAYKQFEQRVSEFAWQQYVDENQLQQGLYANATDRMNAETGYINAQTNVQNLELSRQEFNQKRFAENKRLSNETKRLSMDMRKMDYEQIKKLIDDATISLSAFGLNLNLGVQEKSILNSIKVINAYNAAVPDMSAKSVVETFAPFNRLINQLNSLLGSDVLGSTSSQSYSRSRNLSPISKSE